MVEYEKCENKNMNISRKKSECECGGSVKIP